MSVCENCTYTVDCPFLDRPSTHNTVVDLLETGPGYGEVDDPNIYDYDFCSYYTCDQVGVPALIQSLKFYSEGLLPKYEIKFEGVCIDVLPFGTKQKPGGKNGRFVEIAKPHRIFVLDPYSQEERWVKLSGRTQVFLKRRKVDLEG